MYILILLFYISLVGIILMIFLKRLEIKRGNNIIPSKINQKIERTLSEIFNKIEQLLGLINKRTFISIAQFLVFHVLSFVRKIYVEIKHRTLLNPHGKRMIDAVRGRGEIKNHGASFYLRRISDR